MLGAAVVTLVLVGLVVFSLTNHQRKTGNGCIDFNYSTMIGGAEMYKCGSQARTVCATPPSKQGHRRRLSDRAVRGLPQGGHPNRRLVVLLAIGPSGYPNV